MKKIKELKAIFIVSGHGEGSSGAFDPGAIAKDGTTEREIVNNVVTEVLKLLPPETYLIGGPAGTKSVSGKTEEINSICKRNGFTHENSLGVSVHVNWAAPRGNGTFALYEKEDRNEMLFAEIMGEEVSIASGIPVSPVRPDTSTRHGRLGIVRDTIPTFTLIELGYLSNNLDILKNSPELFAQGIANGIERASEDVILRPKEYPDWAKESIEKAIQNGILNNTEGLYDLIDPVTLDWLFYKTGVTNQEPKNGMTKLRMVVLMDRLKEIEEGQNSLLDK